jgi:recombinational DNA repair ATPase RecF
MYNPQVFISYQSNQDQIKDLARQLEKNGFSIWVDYKNLKPGDRWEDSIREAINTSDFFLACFGKEGARESEIQIALQIASKKPISQTFFIPVRIQESSIPEILKSYIAADLTLPNGMEQLLGILHPKLPTPEPPEDLLNACFKKEVVLFAGWGLYPFTELNDWNGFLIRLIDYMVHADLLELSQGRTLQEYLIRGETNFVAETLSTTQDTVKQAISQITPSRDRDYLIRQFISDLYQQTLIPKSSKLDQALRKAQFCAALTTTYDSYLEKVYKIPQDTILTRLNADAGMKKLLGRDFFLFKLYGEPKSPESILVTSYQLRDIVRENPILEEFLGNLFTSRTILFVGNSLEGISQNLEALGVRSTNRTHYALIRGTPGAAWKLSIQNLERRYNIKVLPYTPDLDNTEILVFLDKLAKVFKTPKIIPTHVKKVSPIRLKQMDLINIGPFEQLTLNFSSQFNILLGDNGVGKSTILRAIALALCGKEALPWADNLLLRGANSGQVILKTTDGKEHTVELYHRPEKDPEMKIKTSLALEAEKWLAIGFPPLRAVSDRHSSGPVKPDILPHTTAQDLLPLVKGGVDARTEDLKQWIINMDYQSKINDPRAERQLTDFFNALEIVTERVKFNRGVIDPKTFEILVETDDGLVPIDLVSQGTQSLLGWIGVLIARLYDIYNDEDKPLKQPALVLMDEIDAHMHPAWQQVLVDDLKKLFPKIQFIVTSHSPLVTITSKPGEVIHMHRDEINRRRIIVEQSKLDVQRWRADQVLTSSLFGLASSNRIIYEWVAEYTSLLAKHQLTKKEENRIKYLSNLLEIRPPEPFEREEARLAFMSIEKALEEQIAKIPEEKQEKIRREAKVQLLESITRQRRPL